MKIVIDSNIVFSAILNTKSKIGQLIINGSRHFDFYTIGLLKSEIIEHKDKILLLTGFTSTQFDITYQFIISKINFIEDILLSDRQLQHASDLVFDIDIEDAPFIALNNHLKAELWTGDKRLINGLRGKGYTNLLTTDDLYEIFLDKELKRRRS